MIVRRQSSGIVGVTVTSCGALDDGAVVLRSAAA